MPEIYSIIVTYNAMKWAEKCFSSLRNSSVPLHTVVIDNGSDDGTQDFLRSNYPEVQLIQNNENLGFGKANNLGIETAYKQDADFFYLMNQDAWIFENTIQELINVFNSYEPKKEIGILSPVHLDGTEKNLDIFLDKYISQNFENRFISDMYLNSRKAFYELKFINAAHWFLPKETVEKVGGFNPYFFHYGEDNEYVNRLHFHGRKILLCPESKAVHDGKQDLAKVDYDRFPDLTLETKILDPAYENGFEKEMKSLWNSRTKHFLTGNFDTAKNLHQKYKKLQKEAGKLADLKLKVSAEGSTFLNL